MIIPDNHFHGRVVVVTGAGQGNGRAIALGFGRLGAITVVTDINPTTVAETASLIRQAGGTAHDFVLDVTEADTCAKLANHIAVEIGETEILINNAGILIRGGIDAENAPQNWQKVLDVNVTGTFNVTYAFLPALRKSRGTIVNVASIASYVGQPTTLGYSPSKGAIKLFTQSLAAELAKDGIRVNAIAPGVIETAMSAVTRDSPERMEKFMARIPMARVGQPDELFGPILFLTSPMASYVTGVVLPVDGGFLAI
jgi:NAD(P)-dependent dehydrogenase (short-subunit alcohol dehydrogenase family)